MSLLRILDANRNRAAEALRTAEDYARFVLEHAPSARQLKEARHALYAAFAEAGLGDATLLPSRDAAGDPGREETPPAPRDARETALAALSRAAESLRVIEEYARQGHAALAACAGRLRYRSYELGSRMLGLRPPFRLYYVLTVGRTALPPADCAAAAAAGGADAVQLRWKDAPARALLDLARDLGRILEPAGVPLIVNDRADVAVAAGAAGAHLGDLDLPPEAARRVLGPGRLLGLTAHSVEEAVKRVQAGADYVGVGTVYPSQAKGVLHGAGLDLVRQTARALDPAALGGVWVAIGGIDATRAREVVLAGAPGVAVGDAIGQATHPEEAARGIRAAVEEARKDRAVEDGSFKDKSLKDRSFKDSART